MQERGRGHPFDLPKVRVQHRWEQLMYIEESYIPGILGWWWRRIKCIFIFRNELLSRTNLIKPNQWNFSQKWSKTTLLVNEWNYMGSCISMQMYSFYIRHRSFWPRFSGRSASFRLIASTSSYKRWKTRFWREKSCVDWDKHINIKSWFAKKKYMVVFSGFASSNGPKMRQRSWNALTLSFAVGWEWIGASG